MNSTLMLLLFAAFGGVCGFYLSVVGFAVTAVGICLLVGLASAVSGGQFTALLLLGAFVAQQVGFFAALAGRAVALHVTRSHRRPDARVAKREFHAEQDHVP